MASHARGGSGAGLLAPTKYKPATPLTPELKLLRRLIWRARAREGALVRKMVPPFCLAACIGLDARRADLSRRRWMIADAAASRAVRPLCAGDGQSKMLPVFGYMV